MFTSIIVLAHDRWLTYQTILYPHREAYQANRLAVEEVQVWVVPTNPLQGKSIQASDLPFSTIAILTGVAKLGILPKKRVDLLSSSPSSGPGPAVTPKSTLPEEDFNAGIPNANASTSSDLVNKIPPTPPATKDPKSPYRLEDSDDELEYTK